jgi:hypothetical protein
MKIFKTIVFAVTLLSIAGAAQAKSKVVQKPSKDYDFKAVKKIVVLPITSDNVDFGKVDKDRVPKIEAILKKTKENLRKNMVDGSKTAKTTIPFAFTATDKKPTTMLMAINVEKFDNGNMLARAVPFAGKAKVDLRVKFLNGQTKEPVMEFTAGGSSQGGIAGVGADAEVLWTAANIANAESYKYLKKLCGLDYDFFSGVTKGLKPGVKATVDVVKEEKNEKDVWKKKKK